jgi:hypothetical protein
MSIALNVYEVTYPGEAGEYESYSVIRSGLTAGKVKYAEYLEYSDPWPDTTYIEFLKMIRCRKIGQSQPRPGEVLPPGLPWLEKRIETANRLIREIGSRGRKFLYHDKENRYSEFHWAGGRLWYTDHYSDMPMILVPGAEGKTNEQKHRFSNGGTMWGLINDFRDYIFGDEDANHNNGYGGLYCPHWGYPEEDMQAIRQIAVELGYLKPREAAKA